MIATFRQRNYFLYVGIAGTLFFSAATVACVIPFFLKNPAQHGFKGPHSVAIVAGGGTAFFGLLALLSAFLIIEYFVSNVSIADTLVQIRGVFRTRQFDASSVKQLKWSERVPGGKLVFGMATKRIGLRLDEFSREDGLAIIRIFRRLIPEDAQINWDNFCHFVALPLREGRSRRLPGTIQPTNPMELPESSRVFVTRARYDRSFFALLLLCTVMAAIIWWQLANPAAFALPIYVILFWALIRFTCPKEGAWRAKWAATPEGRLVGFGHSAAPAIFIGMLLLKLAGLNPNLVDYSALTLLAMVLIAVIVYVSRRGRRQRREDSAAIPGSLARWNSSDAVLVNEASTIHR